MAHNSPTNPAPFPVDECRRVLMEVDIRACGFSLAAARLELEDARLAEELRLAALQDRWRP